MAIQTYAFKPLDQVHYGLAETQGEKNEQLKRDLEKISMQEAGANKRAAMSANTSLTNTQASLAAHERQANQHAGLAAAAQQQQAANQKVINASENRQLDIAEKSNADQSAYRQAMLNNDTARLGISNEQAKQEMDIKRQEAENKQNDYILARPYKEKTASLGQLGDFLNSVKVNDGGFADVTHGRDTLSKITGVDLTGYKNVSAQESDGKLKFFDNSGKTPTPIKVGDSPIEIRRDYIDAAHNAMYGVKKEEPKYSAKVLSGGMDKDGVTLPDELVTFNERTGKIGMTSEEERALNPKNLPKAAQVPTQGGLEERAKPDFSRAYQNVGQGPAPQAGGGLARQQSSGVDAVRSYLSRNASPEELAQVITPFVQPNDFANARTPEQRAQRIVQIARRIDQNGF